MFASAYIDTLGLSCDFTILVSSLSLAHGQTMRLILMHGCARAGRPCPAVRTLSGFLRGPSKFMQYAARAPSKEQEPWKRLAGRIKDDTSDSIYLARLRNQVVRGHVEKIEEEVLEEMASALGRYVRRGGLNACTFTLPHPHTWPRKAPARRHSDPHTPMHTRANTRERARPHTRTRTAPSHRRAHNHTHSHRRAREHA